MMPARSATRATRSVIPHYLSTTTTATSSGILGTSALSKILGSAGHVNVGEGSHVRGVPVRYNSTAALTDMADKVTNMQPVIDYSTMPSNAAQDMGCHIDGFIAIVAHTPVIQEGPLTGRKADVTAATSTVAEVALRFARPGNKEHYITVVRGMQLN